jgi:putative methionine-R-sulfoxide reductase with GAF domain
MMNYFDALLSDIIGKATKVLNADLSILFLYDSKTDELWASAIQDDEVTEIRIPSDKGLAGSAFKSGEAINIADAYKDPGFEKQIGIKSDYHIHSALYMPVIDKQGKTIGVIEVFNKNTGEPFAKQDENILRKFSKEVADVIDKHDKWISFIPGLCLVAGVMLLTSLLHSLLPGSLEKVIGDVLIAIFLGLLINNLFIIPIGMIPGIRFALRHMLRLAVILLGCRLAFTQLIAIGGKAVIMVTILILAALTVAHILGRIAKIPVKLATLIGIGTAVCGNTAIAAIAPVIKAKDDDFSFAVATNTWDFRMYFLVPGSVHR